MRDEAQPTSSQSQQPRQASEGKEAANTETRSDTRGEHTSDEPLYVISVAAKLVGMPAWTLRVLDEQAIVSPRRTDKNRRLYSDRDLMRLARVRTLTEADGVNMNGVRLILKLEDERQPRKGD
jgi:MerR family transcriptional regulator/heat shock protein HspR